MKLKSIVLFKTSNNYLLGKSNYGNFIYRAIKGRVSNTCDVLYYMLVDSLTDYYILSNITYIRTPQIEMGSCVSHIGFAAGNTICLVVIGY